MKVYIRELHTAEEFGQIPRLEEAIWNDPNDTVRPGTMMALAHEGALVAGAFDGEQMVGFVFGFPTNRPTEQHSHMAGVLPEYQKSDIGLRLKLYQRDWALSRGYERIVWTFDPLRGLNAHFNLRKLGASFNEYLPNCYGEMNGINAGAPSDRAYARWDLRVERVFGRIYAPPPLPDLHGVLQINRLQDQTPVHADLNCDAPKVLLQIPEDWGEVLTKDPGLALHWRDHSRQLFEHYFAEGYHAVDFVRGPNRYLLERP